MIHETTIKKYDGTLKDLANDMGDLQYDALAKFLEYMATKIAEDGAKDRARGRTQLAKCLEKSADLIGKSTKEMEKAWGICEPYMKRLKKEEL